MSTSTSSDVAEVHAMSWAIMYGIMAWRERPTPSVAMYVDSHYAHGMAAATFSPNTHGSLISVMARLKAMLETIVPTTWHYEPSHELRPFNEFVDVA